MSLRKKKTKQENLKISTTLFRQHLTEVLQALWRVRWRLPKGRMTVITEKYNLNTHKIPSVRALSFENLTAMSIHDGLNNVELICLDASGPCSYALLVLYKFCQRTSQHPIFCDNNDDNATAISLHKRHCCWRMVHALA